MQPHRFEGLPTPRQVLGPVMARALRPPRRRTVAQWAEEERIVSPESGSPNPGPWTNAYTPHLIEPMECVSLTHPSQHVVFQKCQQAGFSEVGLNLIGAIVSDHPAPVLVVLPTTDEVKKYVKTKLQPMIDATPAVRAKVLEQKSRDEEGSTTTFKRFEGGFLQITGANSSSGLKMITARVVIREEVTEYPADVDNQGDPAELALGRATTWLNYGKAKIVDISTPGIKGTCRIAKNYERSDMRRLYLPCPHCGTFQVLKWDHLDKEGVEPVYACQKNGCVIEYRSLHAMLRGCKWVKTYPGTDDNPAPPALIAPADIERWRERPAAGREPGFAFDGLSSPLTNWTEIVKRWRSTRGDAKGEKDFCMQVLAEPWEERGEAPDEKKLFAARAEYAWRQIPSSAPVLCGAADVQGNRIEWAVYAFGAAYSSWLIDKGIIEGDPAGSEIWPKLDEVLTRQYPDQSGKLWPLDAFGIDTGFVSHRCYQWARTHAHTGKVFALDGRPGWRLPGLGTPSKKDIDFEGKKIGLVMLWPVGTWGLKSEVYSGLYRLMKGRDPATGQYPAGTMYVGDVCDLAYCEQLTAEHLVTKKGRHGLAVQEWEKLRGRPNEALDIAVYSRALAHHCCDGLTPEQWASLAAMRGGSREAVQKDLASLWAPGVAEAANAPQAEQQAEPVSARRNDEAQDDWFSGRSSSFWN